jgi:hypothetical protein
VANFGQTKIFVPGTDVRAAGATFSFSWDYAKINPDLRYRYRKPEFS